MSTSNQRYIRIEDLRQKQKNLIGITMMSISLLTGYVMYLKPEGLKVPLYIAIIALAVFFVSGLGIFLRGRIQKKSYNSLMLMLIFLMSVIPSLDRIGSCREAVLSEFLHSLRRDLPCRIGFGIGGIILACMFILGCTILKKK